MKIKQLDNIHFFYSVLSGASEVIAAKDSLNAINVFPVPDGDTGSNLAALMTTILAQAKMKSSPRETSKNFADSALQGARGNSGIIFAQYLSGLSNNLADEPTISMERFVHVVKQAALSARNTISTPVEGTIITVMHAWAEALDKLQKSAEDFLDLLNQGYAFAKQALQETTKQLKVLKDANVVDAGAKGFVHFLDGFLRFLKTGEYKQVHEAIGDDLSLQDEHLEDPGELRYCTEALIQGENIDIPSLRQNLQTFGNSVIVAGNSNLVRLHLHTKNPADVFVTLREYGHIIQQKVDDMYQQFEAAHRRKYSIALVTDSVADIPKEWLETYQVYLLPMQILFANDTFYDKLTIDSTRFYQWMDQVEHYPSSAQPSLPAIKSLLSFLQSYYQSIVVINVSSKMSGTFQSVSQVAAELNQASSAQIHVIDSKQNSGAQGLVVYQTAQAIAANYSLQKVLEVAHKAAATASIFVSVPTLKYMVKSGRVSKATGLIGKITNLKPVISIDKEGQGIIFEKAFSIKGNTKKILKAVAKAEKEKGIQHYVILHANARERAESFSEQVQAIVSFKPLYTMDISSVIALNAGIGSIGIAFIEKEKEAS